MLKREHAKLQTQYKEVRVRCGSLYNLLKHKVEESARKVYELNQQNKQLVKTNAELNDNQTVKHEVR